MCYVKEVAFNCGHFRREVVGKPCPGAEQRLKDPVKHPKSCLDDMDVEERVYGPNVDCGGGGSLMSCLQKQCLDDFQMRLLKICESHVRKACSKYNQQSERVWKVKLKFQLDFLEQTPASPELQELIRRAVEVDDSSWVKLKDAFHLCGQLIVADRLESGTGRNLNVVARSYAAAIQNWLSRDLSNLRDVASRLERKARWPTRRPARRVRAAAIRIN